jgi:hypothetical protein
VSLENPASRLDGKFSDGREEMMHMKYDAGCSLEYPNKRSRHNDGFIRPFILFFEIQVSFHSF